MMNSQEIIQLAKDLSRELEINLFFGSPQRRAYIMSRHHRDRPRGTAKIRGKRRKSNKLRKVASFEMNLEGMGLDGIISDVGGER